ncbi:hypothetical protein PG987_004737 [Apiospora arundinis]
MSQNAFPQFSGFPPEIRIMVWNEFIQTEAANRLVFLVEGRDPDRDDSGKFYRSRGSVMSNSMRMLPSRWLVSPLLSVSRQARAIALEHYPMRIDIFDQPGLTFKYRWCDPLRMDSKYSLQEREARKDTWVRPCSAMPRLERPRPRCGFHRNPGWYRRQDQSEAVEWDVASDIVLGLDVWEPGGVDWAVRRGCVYLNAATDRFTEQHSLMTDRPLGLRALSDALLNFKNHAIPFDLLDVLERRRPAPLRYASAALPKTDVLDRVRNVVFAKDPEPRGVAADGRVVVDATWVARHSPQALGPEGCSWTFDASKRVTRTFFDDVEDKGAEHLLLRKVTTEAIESESEYDRALCE